jgi:ABC-type branched-subunit amino acid transport system substrate-binding protein
VISGDQRPRYLGVRCRRVVAAFCSAAMVSGTLLLASGSGVASAAPAPIKIGEIAPSGTSVQNWDIMIAAVKAGVADLNAHGGIKGHKVEFDWCNEEEVLNAAVACAHKMVQDGVVATAGDYTQFGDDVTPILNTAHIPEVNALAQSLDEFNDPNVVLSDMQTYQYEAYPFIAKQLGYKRIGVALVDIPAASFVGNLVEAGAKAAGMQFVGTTLVPLTATDFAPYVQAMQSDKAQVVVSLLPGAGTAGFATAVGQAGDPFTGNWGGYTLSEQKQLGKSLTKTFLVDGYPPASALTAKQFPGIARFLADQKAESKTDMYSSINQGGETDYPLAAWVGVMAIGQVASTIKGAITAPALLKAFDSAQDLNVQGIVKNWTPSSPGPPGFSRISNPDFYGAEYVKRGVYKLVNPKPENIFKLAKIKVG